jgi:hypothetical protein
MDISDLSTLEQESLPRILAYWVEHWDWECPALFGLELVEFQAILACWPAGLTNNEETTALAIIGSLRELLYGASAVRPERVEEISGVSREAAIEVLGRLSRRIDRVLG